MAESFEETCVKCGQVTLVIPGVGSTYSNPTPLCDDCKEELTNMNIDWRDIIGDESTCEPAVCAVNDSQAEIDNLGSQITYWESVCTDARINIDNLTMERIKLIRTHRGESK